MLTRRNFAKTAIVAAAAPWHQVGAAQSVLTPDQYDKAFWGLPREITVNNLNTGERGKFLYYENGEYVHDAYISLCKMLRDHRENKAVQLDVRLFDLAWANIEWYYRAQGRRPKYLATSAYRTHRTNALVGGSPGGKHPFGAAIDGRLEGVELGQYAAMSRLWRAGGVGLYRAHVSTDIREKPTFWQKSGLED